MLSETYYTDVLVVGGGIAGLYAANSAVDNEKYKVTLLTAGELGAGGCSKKTHGINAALNPKDSVSMHVGDTLKGGGYLNNIDLVRKMCTNIPDKIKELEVDGLELDKDGDMYQVGTYGGSTCSRSIHKKDYTGLLIVQQLVAKTVLSGVYVKENRWVTKLLIDKSDNKVVGAVALNTELNMLEIYYASSVVLATGGGACVYPISSISKDKLGTGMLLGFDAGVNLIDMEMVQFHPTGVLLEDGHPQNGCLLEEEMRTAGGRLLNNNNERYMFNYDARGESATRDIVARSSYIEIMEGRGVNGGIILDLSNFSCDDLKERFPNTVKRLREIDIDLLDDNKIIISPTAHFMIGGLEINDKCATAVQGLFVCGEDAGGIHGANRLGGNGVADAIVFGDIAGKSAQHFSSRNHLESDRLEAFDLGSIEYYDMDEHLSIQVDRDIKKIMWKYVGLVRNKIDLQQAVSELKQYQSRYQHNLKKLDVREHLGDKKKRIADNLYTGIAIFQKLKLSLIIAMSALERDESVGAHYRTDSVDSTESNRYNILLSKDKDSILIKKKSVEPVPTEAEAITA